jgi:hypothetical protein
VAIIALKQTSKSALSLFVSIATNTTAHSIECSKIAILIGVLIEITAGTNIESGYR